MNLVIRKTSPYKEYGIRQFWKYLKIQQLNKKGIGTLKVNGKGKLITFDFQSHFFKCYMNTNK